jgi:hypothetical protein
MKGKFPARNLALHGLSSKAAHEAAKAAGEPVMEVRVGNRKSDGSVDFVGWQYRGDESGPVMGTLPGAWRDFVNSQKAKPGAPKKTAIKVARFLSALHFYFRFGGGIKAARIRAAQLMEPGIDPDVGERKYRSAEKEVRSSTGVLVDFDRLFGVPDNWILAAHKSAIVDVQAGGVQLLGEFWAVKIGSAGAEHLQIDHFLARVDSNG